MIGTSALQFFRNPSKYVSEFLWVWLHPRTSGVFVLLDQRSGSELFGGLGHAFFFRLLSNAFSDFGSVGRKRKKKKQKKLEKESGTRRTGISA